MAVKDFHDEIKSLIGQGFTNPEIGEELGLTRDQVSVYVARNFNGNANYMKKKTKHAHLHKEILSLRLHKSDEYILRKLNLTKNEMKSCMTLAYKKKDLLHLRKETRRRDAWTKEELKFLLRWSGFISRREINSQLKRGKSDTVIKEKLQELGLSSKNVNGMSLSQFQNVFKTWPYYYIKTTAGPSHALWNIVPWMHINEMIKGQEISCASAIETYIDAMSMFQEWIHGKDYWKSSLSTPKFKGIK